MLSKIIGVSDILFLEELHTLLFCYCFERHLCCLLPSYAETLILSAETSIINVLKALECLSWSMTMSCKG